MDDGARDAAEARAALEAMEAEGIEAAVATPHLDASLAEADPEAWAERLADFDLAWEALTRTAGSLATPLRLERGAELRLDAPDPPVSDGRVRIAGSRYVLVEFDAFRVPAYGDRQLAEVADAGWTPLLAHPERYRGIGERLSAAGAWREAGARLQVNAGSLVGQYGDAARRVAWTLLERGWADVVASDHHARGPVRWAEAREAVERRGRGPEAAGRLFGTNPARVLADRGLVAVPPVERPGLWDRVRGWWSRGP